MLYGLPADYFDTYIERIQAVTKADLARVAREYLNPEQFAIVVGDQSRVEAGLRELPYGLDIIKLEKPVILAGS